MKGNMLIQRGGQRYLLFTHVVEAGESLSVIAWRFQTTWEQVAKLTYQHLGTHPDYLMPGMIVVIGEERVGG